MTFDPSGWWTDRLQPEDHGDLLLRADGDQVVGQQLAGRQELVVPPLIDEDVEPRAGVGGGQRRGVVRLVGEAESARQYVLKVPLEPDPTCLGLNRNFLFSPLSYSDSVLTSHEVLSGPRYPEKAFCPHGHWTGLQMGAKAETA